MALAKIRSGHSVRGKTGTKPQGNTKAQATKRTRRRSVAVEVEPVNNAFGVLGWHLPCAQPWLRAGRGTNGAVQAAMASTEGRSLSSAPMGFGYRSSAGRNLDCGAIPSHVSA